jgi:hypothetical protein
VPPENYPKGAVVVLPPLQHGYPAPREQLLNPYDLGSTVPLGAADSRKIVLQSILEISSFLRFVEFGIFFSNDMAEGAIPLAGNS